MHNNNYLMKLVNAVPFLQKHVLKACGQTLGLDGETEQAEELSAYMSKIQYSELLLVSSTDCWEGISINSRAGNADLFSAILEIYDKEKKWMNNEETSDVVLLMTSLALRRELTLKEKRTVQDAIEIFDIFELLFVHAHPGWINDYEGIKREYYDVHEKKSDFFECTALALYLMDGSCVSFLLDALEGFLEHEEDSSIFFYGEEYRLFDRVRELLDKYITD